MQNENDNMHSMIEKQKKIALAFGPNYVPSQWISVIFAAKKNRKTIPYHRNGLF
jgi:hypothetical protein